MTPPNFLPFPKMPRISRDCIITEKLDGTNAQVLICEYESAEPYPQDIPWLWVFSSPTVTRRVAAGSRNRWITEVDDNFGFAAWVLRNVLDLQRLGLGRHFGEWWGQGIQRGYGLKEKRFSLFNADTKPENLPACCSLVPALYRGGFDTTVVENILDVLRHAGSQAAPGFMDPEGVVVWHTAARMGFKKTIKDDAKGKT